MKSNNDIRRKTATSNVGSVYNHQANNKQVSANKVVKFKKKKTKIVKPKEKIINFIKALDYELLLAAFFLVVFGLVMLYSISAYSASVEMGNATFYFKKQLLYTVIGAVGVFVVSSIHYKWVKKFSSLIFFAVTVACLLVASQLGSSAGGAQRRLNIGPIGLQPSEFMKIAMIIIIPTILCSYSNQIKGSWSESLWKPSRMSNRILNFLLNNEHTSIILENNTRVKKVIEFFTCGWMQVLYALGIGFLVVWKFTDNLSTAIIVAGIGGIVASLTWRKKPFWKYLGIVMLIPLIKIIARMYVDYKMSIGHVYTKEALGFRLWRIFVWLNPELDIDGTMQTTQGIYAFSSGGFLGKGLGQGTQKLTRIPEVQNDMILSAIMEEIGICGMLLIVALYVILLHRLYVIAKEAPDLFSQLLVIGVFVHIALQVLCNMGVITGLLPNTGITLPFFSYGGTAILGLSVELGLVLGISTRSKLKKQNLI